MSQVLTEVGLIDRDQLRVVDVVTEENNSRAVVSQWFLGDKLVRQDTAVSIFQGQALFGDQAEI